MTPEEFKEKMNDAICGDIELDHIEMDSIMCKLLEDLGYSDGVSVFYNTIKWYS